MRSIARAFAAASLVLLGAAAARALEANLPPVVPQVQPAEPAMISLVGKASLRAGDVRKGGQYFAQLAYDLDAETFSLVPFPIGAADAILYGRLAPKGTSGRKFTLFLDGASHEKLTELLASLGQSLLTDTDVEEILGDSTRLVMTLDENDEPSLRVKSRVLTKGYGEVVFKANVTQGEPPQ